MPFVVTEHPGSPPIVELEDRDAGSAVRLAPERGGMAIGFRVKGREVFYLDRATFLDPGVNVRGGGPVLFPSPGKLRDDRWQWQGRSGAMKQHGFARNLHWHLVATSTEGEARATLGLASSLETAAVYPWDFSIELAYALRGPTLRIGVTVENRSGTPMPFGFGLHPYFLVPQSAKAATRIEVQGTRAFDNTLKKEVPFAGFELTRAEVDLHLVREGDLAMTLPDGARIHLTGSEEIRRWVVWTVAGKDFVCLEPWTCPGDALNTAEDLLVVGPGAARQLWVAIATSDERE